MTETLIVDGRDYTMLRTCDPSNRVISQTFADGKVEEQSYDNRNVVTTVTYDGDTVLSKSTDAGYRCTSETFGNGLVRSINFGRQDNLRTNDKAIGIDELNFDYSYAADKNETNPSGMFTPLGFNVTYDDGNRVTNRNRVADYLDARETKSWNHVAARAYFDLEKNGCKIVVKVKVDTKARIRNGFNEKVLGDRLHNQASEALKPIKEVIRDGSLLKQYQSDVDRVWSNKFKLCCEGCGDCLNGLNIVVQMV